MRVQPDGRKTIETVQVIDTGIHVDHLEKSVVQWSKKWNALVDLPIFGYCVVLGANEKLHRPNNESKEDIHPSPPYLRRVIQQKEVRVHRNKY